MAKKAVERGLSVKPWVKTSLAPGSKVVQRYLEASNLLPYLEALKFHIVGFGCTTCIGNSGPLPEPVRVAIEENDLAVAAVLSGNRNFEGRVSPSTRANYLASPPLVVAYALAGTVDIDLASEPLGHDPNGEPVFLQDIWPSQAEIQSEIRRSLRPAMFEQEYGNVFDGNETWNEVAVPEGNTLRLGSGQHLRAGSALLHRPDAEVPRHPADLRAPSCWHCWATRSRPITSPRPAASPRPAPPPNTCAVRHRRSEWNSYGARRGNHEVMMRGTFANIRIRNRLVPGVEGGYTVYQPTGEQMSMYDAAMKIQADGTPLIVLAGKEYGTGSSRDWAAKGPYLLGVKAVIAESFERIHRSNLVGMGVLPLQFQPGQNAESLGLSGFESYDILGLDDAMQAGQTYTVRATAADGSGQGIRGHQPHRHAGRGGVLQERRHLADGAAQNGV